MILLYWYNSENCTLLMSLCWCLFIDVTLLMSICSANNRVVWLLLLCIYVTLRSPLDSEMGWAGEIWSKTNLFKQHESKSIPWVHVCTISLILYHESMSIPWVFVKSMVHFYTMRNTVFRYTEIQITRLKKYKFPNNKTQLAFIQK